MILLLLKVTLLLGATLAATGAMRRSSAAMRHLICACGLAGAVLLGLTFFAPAGTAVFSIKALSVPGTVRMSHAANGFRGPMFRVVPWIWLAGTMVLLGRMAIGYIRLSMLIGDVNSTGTESVFADVSVPLVAGLPRPVILLPRAAREWPALRMEAALRHEREHVRRKDLWTLLLAQVACAVYWFHPLVWMVSAQLRREQEQACDDAVILSGMPPACYAEALLATAQNLTSTDLIGCHMITAKTLRSRIARLLTQGVSRASTSSALRCAAVLFAGAAVMIGLLHGQAQAPDENGVYKVGNDVAAPSVIFKVDPEYSEEARAEKVDGTVRLSVLVGTDGLAHDINVEQGVGSGLDEKAVEAIQQWHFKPANRDGEAVKVRAKIEVNFKLQ